jgi:hypothetical protein
MGMTYTGREPELMMPIRCPNPRCSFWSGAHGLLTLFICQVLGRARMGAGHLALYLTFQVVSYFSQSVSQSCQDHEAPDLVSYLSGCILF